MALQIKPLRKRHFGEAGWLVARRYAALRRRVPSLPPRWEDGEAIAPLIAGLGVKALGAAAFRNGRMVGFMHGRPWRHFLGGVRKTQCPEWANAAEESDSRRIYEALYAHVSALWVADGCLQHQVGQFADDRAAIEGWHWLGFGMCAADAIRPLTDIEAVIPDGIVVRRATSDDIDDVIALLVGLVDHLNAPPASLQHTYEPRDHVAGWLGYRTRPTWLAYRGDQAVAYLRAQSFTYDASTMVHDKHTASITGAFTVEEARGQGIATALLAPAIRWARKEGFFRCAVDFAPMNTPAARFWTRHFAPVCYTLVRQFDPPVGPNHEE